MIANLIRLVVTVGILVLIFRSVDLDGVASTLRNTDPIWLIAALALQLLSQLVAAYRWRTVMVALDYGMDTGFYLRSFFKGTFFNQGLPTSIGGDAIRVLDVAREGHRKRDAFSGVLVDRGLGVAGLLFLNLAANAIKPDLLPDEVFWALNGIVLAGIGGFIIFWQLHRFGTLQRLRLGYPLFVLSSRLATVLRGDRRLPQQAALSIVVHLLSMLSVFCVGRGVGLDYDLLTFLVIVPPVILLTIVPISMAGWGVREGAMIGLFTLIGAPKAAVLSMSILYGLVLIAASLPGLYVYLRGKNRF